MPHRRRIITPTRVAVVTAALLLSSVQAAPLNRTAATLPSNEAAVVHALNRLGFGPAPGQVARVMSMGLEAYIDSQLHPERVSDGAVRQRLAGFETLSLDTATIAERYYEPALQARREIQRRAGAQTGAAGAAGGAMEAQEPAMTDQAASPDAAREARLAQLPPEERARIRELRREEQKVLGELGQQKLLRAVYSERQLEEVLVDFWFNHFNVFAGKGPVRVYLDRVRARRDPAARARHASATCSGATAEEPGDALLSRQLAERRPNRRAGNRRAGRGSARTGLGGVAARSPRPAQPGAQQACRQRDAARPQRELRARAAGAAHARRRRRLHAGRRRRGRRARSPAGPSQPRQGRRLPLRRRDARPRREDRARPRDQGRRRHEDGEQVLDILAAHPSTARFIATKLARRFVARRRRRRRSSTARRERFTRHEGRPPRGAAHHRHVARVLRARGHARQGEDAVRVRGRARCAPPAPTCRTPCRWCASCARWACRSTSASRRPATTRRPTRGSSPGALVAA